MIFLPSRMYLLQQLSDALACHQVGVSGCGGEGAAAVVWTPLTSHLPRSETRSTAAADPGWGEAAATLLECYNHSHFDHLEIDCRFRFLIFNWHSLTRGPPLLYIFYFPRRSAGELQDVGQRR